MVPKFNLLKYLNRFNKLNIDYKYLKFHITILNIYKYLIKYLNHILLDHSLNRLNK